MVILFFLFFINMSQNQSDNNNVKAFFDKVQWEKEKIKSILQKKQENDRITLTHALSQWIKPVKIKVLIWDNITDVIEKSIKKMILESVLQNKNTAKMPPIQFNFNGVLILISLSDVFSWIKDISTLNYVKLKDIIDLFVQKKLSEYSDNLWLNHTLSNTATQLFIHKKAEEEKRKKEEEKTQEVLEKQSTSWPMQFTNAKMIDISHLSSDILVKYNISTDTWRAIDDTYGMARVDWETMRKIWLEKNQNWYWAAVYSYAERWAKLMQIELDKWAKLNDIAQYLSNDADIEWITWFMYWAAVSILSVSILSSCRKYWEELRKWYNKKHNY